MTRKATKALGQKFHVARLPTKGRYIVLYAKRLVPLLKSLRNAWQEGAAVRHAQTTGLVLGRLAYDPQVAIQMLPTIMSFVERRGPQGIDGLYISCLSAAQVLNASLFARGVALAEMYDLGAQTPVREGMWLARCHASARPVSPIPRARPLSASALARPCTPACDDARPVAMTLLPERIRIGYPRRGGSAGACSCSWPRLSYAHLARKNWRRHAQT